MGTFHKDHFDPLANYSIEEMLNVIDNIEPDVVFVEAREESYEQYGVVDGPIDMCIAYCQNQITMREHLVDNQYNIKLKIDVSGHKYQELPTKTQQDMMYVQQRGSSMNAGGRDPLTSQYN